MSYSTSDFKPGDRVKFIGYRHPDAEQPWGHVSSVNDKYVFVKFDKQVSNLGWNGTTSQSCLPKDLIKE